ncbi:hypothetical protein V8C86DRAFT_2475706 [Haematococcus lacustris]
MDAGELGRDAFNNACSPAIVAAPAAGSQDDDQATCRLCWGVEDDEEDMEGGLVSPCQCSGSLKWIHYRCLREWQATLESQGQFRKAQQCEICKSPWRLDVLAAHEARVCDKIGWWAVQRRRLRLLLRSWLDGLQARSLGGLVFRLWRAYVLGVSFSRSMQLGVRGLVAGLKLGQQLVRDHGQAVTQALVMVAEVVGRPAAQVLWIQVFTAVTFFLACELVYSALLGALLGAVVGFTQGYVMTIRHHTSLGLHLAGHLARLAVKGGLKLGRWAVGAGVLLRKLAARGLITP